MNHPTYSPEIRLANSVARRSSAFPALARLLPLLLMLPALTACGFFRPTLQAAFCSTVPLPNGFVEKYPWENAATLTLSAHRGTGRFTDSRPVQIKACTDGRAISIMVRWVDQHDAKVGRFWAWDEKNSVYRLQQFPIDQCAVLWPLSKGANFDLWQGKAATYDVWHWRAGWSDISGLADDQRMFVRQHPWGTLPGQVKGSLYPLDKRRGMVELQWADDAGTPGTVPMPRPVTFLKYHLAALEPAEAQGSVADVKAQGVYTPRLRSGQDGRSQETWRYYPQGDDWFVEFYRMLVTPSREDDDAQLRGRGPFTLAIAVWDEESEDSFYITDPIRLVLPRLKK